MASYKSKITLKQTLDSEFRSKKSMFISDDDLHSDYVGMMRFEQSADFPQWRDREAFALFFHFQSLQSDYPVWKFNINKLWKEITTIILCYQMRYSCIRLSLHLTPEILAPDPGNTCTWPGILARDSEILARDPEILARDPEILARDREILARDILNRLQEDAWKFKSFTERYVSFVHKWSAP